MRPKDDIGDRLIPSQVFTPRSDVRYSETPFAGCEPDRDRSEWTASLSTPYVGGVTQTMGPIHSVVSHSNYSTERVENTARASPPDHFH
jgi:hypothetical protein